MSAAGPRILVTGARGNVGAETVAALLAASDAGASHGGSGGGGGPGAAEIRVALRDPAGYRAPGHGDDGHGAAASPVRPVRFDFADPATWDGALEGIDALFLMRPPAIADIDRTLGPFIEKAAGRPGRKIVFLSLIGAERMPYVPHHVAEARIAASGAPYVFLRPSFFMQNLSTTHRREIAEEDEIFVPAGRGKTNFVDVRDIGEVAAKVLLEAGHEGAAYELTGAEALDYYEVAALISEAIGRPVRYARPSTPRYVLRALARGTPLGFALVTAGLYAASALGVAARTTEVLQELLGRAPRGFRAFASEAADAWRRP